MKAIHRKRLNTLGTFTGVGLVVGAGMGLLFQQMDGGPLLPYLARAALVGTLIGAFFGVGEEFVFGGVARGLGYVALNATRVAIYAAAIVAALIVVNAGDQWMRQGAGFLGATRTYVFGPTMGRDLVVAVFVALLGASILEVRRLHNPGDLRRFLLGRYREPEEEERIFLLADLEDSTGLAERLGNVRYSKLIRDCYYDISEAILAWRGQVYQYVGDEVIVSWPFEQGVSEARCVRCFFDMVDLLEAKRERNLRRYGASPRFRAGIHGGRIVTTWVGEAKKELAFHGDALNVAARMERACRELDSVCLVSDEVLRRLELPPHLRAVPKGEVRLRGKEGAVELWSVERATGP